MAAPKIRFKKDDGSDYPAWEKCVLDDIFTERNELQVITEDAPLLAFTIEQGVIYPEDKKTNKRDFLMKDKTNKKFLLTEYDDIIYNPANLRYGAIHRNKLGRGVVSPIYAIFQTNQNPAFIESVVTNPKFIKRSMKYLEGTVIKLMTLKPRDFLKMEIFTPCLEEQQKIVVLLSAIDELINASEDEITKLNIIKKGLLQKMFPKRGEKVPEIRFPGYTDDWVQSKISDCCEQLSATLNPQDTPNITFVEYSMPAFDNNETPNTVTGKSMNSIRKILDRTCLLINKLNVRKRRVWYVENPKERAVCSAEFVPICSEKIDLRCLKHIIANDSFTSYLENCSSGSSNSQKRVTPDVIMGATITLPSFEEQKKIGHFFAEIDSIITLHQQERDKYRELKKGLLQQMFI